MAMYAAGYITLGLMTLARAQAIALAAIYGVAALALLVAGVALLASVIASGGDWRAMLAKSFVVVLVGVVFLTAAVGVFRERKWAFWPSLGVSLVALALVASVMPDLLFMYRHTYEPSQYSVSAALLDGRLYELLVGQYGVRVLFLAVSSLLAALVFVRAK